MGWLMRTKRSKNPDETHFQESVVRSFAHIKDDMELQRQWIAYLNHLHGMLSEAHESHRDLTGKDLDELKRWIVYLQENTVKHEAAIQKFEGDLAKTIHSYNRFLLHLHKEVRQSAERESLLRKHIVDEVKSLLVEHKREVTEHLTRVQDHTLHQVREHTDRVKGHLAHEVEQHINRLKPSLQEKTPENHSLSNPEQKLFNLLLSQSDPVSYQFLSDKTGNSVNTVRVIMNSLRKRGLVEENLLPTGVKLWNAANRERVKKLYNITS
jgi:hypothetical protein